jgi:hypothetical protein
MDHILAHLSFFLLLYVRVELLALLVVRKVLLDLFAGGLAIYVGPGRRVVGAGRVRAVVSGQRVVGAVLSLQLGCGLTRHKWLELLMLFLVFMAREHLFVQHVRVLTEPSLVQTVSLWLIDSFAHSRGSINLALI